MTNNPWVYFCRPLRNDDYYHIGTEFARCLATEREVTACLVDGIGEDYQLNSCIELGFDLLPDGPARIVSKTEIPRNLFINEQHWETFFPE